MQVISHHIAGRADSATPFTQWPQAWCMKSQQMTLHHVTSHYITNTASKCTKLYYITSLYITFYHKMSLYSTQQHGLSAPPAEHLAHAPPVIRSVFTTYHHSNITLHHSTSHHVKQYHTTPHHTVSHFTTYHHITRTTITLYPSPSHHIEKYNEQPAQLATPFATLCPSMSHYVTRMSRYAAPRPCVPRETHSVTVTEQLPHTITLRHSMSHCITRCRTTYKKTQRTTQSMYNILCAHTLHILCTYAAHSVHTLRTQKPHKPSD